MNGYSIFIAFLSSHLLLSPIIAQHSCDNIFGGGWLLVRHSYNGWHQATDNLNGTDIYGTSDNDPESSSIWSIEYNQYLETGESTLFMFSNGNCSEWLVTTNDEWSTFYPNDYGAYIISSNYDKDYFVTWFNRNTYSQDPLISYRDHTFNKTILYEEDNYDGDLQRFSDDDKSVNVWIS